MIGIALRIKQGSLSGNPAVDGNTASYDNGDFLHALYLQPVTYSAPAIPFSIQKLRAPVLQHSEIPKVHFKGIMGILGIIRASLKRKNTVFFAVRHIEFCNFFLVEYAAAGIQKQRTVSCPQHLPSRA